MTDDQIDTIANVLLKMVHGPLCGPGCEPMGLEALTMSIGGKNKPGESCVTDSLDGIASAIRDLAEAIREHK